ncbi:hypothetical protein L7F22_063955 [Adiantum nelumboides]|nr:hypothetical protein [Adiantum nelumboides]
MDVPPLEHSHGDGVETKLAEMRASLTADGIPSQGIDDATLLRFLRARQMHVPPAFKMLAEHQRWRASFVPRGFIVESEVEGELAQGKFYMQGNCNKAGHPVTLVLARRHFFNKSNFEEFKRFVVYSLDKIIASAPAGIEKYVTIVDLEGLGYKNMDFKSLATGLQLLQNYYPERLAKLYFVNSPSIFIAFWKMASRFIDKVTRDKIFFLDDGKTCHVLVEEFGADVIPKAYGGKAELITIQDAHVPDWPPKDPCM